MAIAGLIGAIAIGCRGLQGDSYCLWWAVVVFLLSMALLARFLKFYSAFGAELLLTHADLIDGENKNRDN